jgi:hypothetical protein
VATREKRAIRISGTKNAGTNSKHLRKIPVEK